MELNRNNKSAKLYRWFYETTEMPDNLCQYFWELVLAIIISPIKITLELPTFIVEKITREESGGKKFAIGIIYWFILICGLCVLFSATRFFYDYKEGSLPDIISVVGLAIIAGVIGGFIIVFIVCLVEDYILRRKDKKKKNLIVEFIKAKKNKYCPKIDWFN